MYERFTDTARKSMQLANQEAQRLRQDYIGTEHILLGLIEEGVDTLSQGGSVAVNALQSLDVDPSRLRSEVVKLLTKGPEPVGIHSKLPQTSNGKKVIEYAMEEARQLKHNYVGTEHLLLGLMRAEGVASTVLHNEGLELDEVREEVLRLLRWHVRTSPAPPSPPPLKEIEDLPDELQAVAAALAAEIGRLQAEKEEAVGDKDFERAAFLRDEEHKTRQRRGALFREWLASRTVDPGWLSANGDAVFRLARSMSEHRDWNLLPALADELERAGCTDAQLIDHCRQPRVHSRRCWVVELLLAHA